MLTYILVGNTYVALCYDFSDAADAEIYYLLEWYRSFKKGDLAKDLYRIYPEAQITVSKPYYILSAGALQDVYWEQNGLAFHAVTPADLSMEALAAFCDAEAVRIEQR